MATIDLSITLDGSGEYDASLGETFVGYVETILVNKNGQTGNPVIDLIEAGGLQQQILDVTESGSGNTLYAVRKSLVTNANSAITNSFGRYLVESPLNATITSGDNAGVVTFIIQYEPISR